VFPYNLLKSKYLPVSIHISLSLEGEGSPLIPTPPRERVRVRVALAKAPHASPPEKGRGISARPWYFWIDTN
jgi:hypothetical protein